MSWDFEEALKQALKLSPEKLAACQIDPFIEEIFETFQKMDNVVQKTEETKERCDESPIL